jgi:hypothetical protein
MCVGKDFEGRSHDLFGYKIGLFKDAFQLHLYLPSNGRMVVGDELERCGSKLPRNILRCY